MKNLEIIRSTYLPTNKLMGQKLFCSFSNGWYSIHTKWEEFKRFRNINKALSYFEEFAEAV